MSYTEREWVHIKEMEGVGRFGDWVLDLDRRLWINEKDGRTLPVIAGGGPANTIQRAFRFYNDDGSLTTATAIDVEGGDITITDDSKIRPRFSTQEDNGGNENADFIIRASYNSGAYFSVTTSTSYIKSISSDQSITDDTAITTQRLTNGSGSWEDGHFDDDGAIETTIGLTSEYTEVEFCLEPVWADLSDSDTIDLQVWFSGPTQLDGYTDTPRITVSKAAPASDVKRLAMMGVG